VAAAILRRAEILAEEKLLTAEGLAEARLQRAEGPAEEKLLKAEGLADARLQRAEGPADERLRQAATEAEARLRQVYQELAQQRDVFERFFALSLDMMCIASTDGYFKRVNPAFDALGYSQEDLLSRPFLDFVHSDDNAATLAEIAKLDTGVPTIHFENRYRCKDGSYRWLSWRTGPPPSSGKSAEIARDV